MLALHTGDLVDWVPIVTLSDALDGVILQSVAHMWSVCCLLTDFVSRIQDESNADTTLGGTFLVHYLNSSPINCRPMGRYKMFLPIGHGNLLPNKLRPMGRPGTKCSPLAMPLFVGS
jgi:hypothetical protein